MKKISRRTFLKAAGIAGAALGLTACGSGAASTVSSAASAAGASSGAASSAAAAVDFSTRDPYTLKVMMLGAGDSDEAIAAVSAKLSEIAKEKLNADVEITRVGFGSYDTQLNLALSSGEELDLFNLFDNNRSVLANNGQIAQLDDLLSQYGTGIQGIVADADWECAKINGSIYAVPTNKDHAGALGFIMRKDYFEETGYTLDSLKTFDDLHEVLAKVKEKHPDLYPAVSDSGKMLTLQGDNLGDINNIGAIIDPYTPGNTTVENIYASDYYKQLCTQMYQWAQEGLIMPDASTNSEGADSMIGAEKAFGRFSGNIILTSCGLTEQEQTAQHELVVWTYKDALSTTDGTMGCGWAVCGNSGDPERAMALLNMMYTDPEVANLVGNGIEGEQYKIVDQAAGTIDFPDGKDAMSTGYSRMVWAWPNEQITYLWNGEPSTKWTELADFNKNAVQSSVKGFSFDSSPVANEIAACTNVISKYNQALLCGSLNPDQGIPDFLKELTDAGIDKVIAEKQSQINTWLASK